MIRNIICNPPLDCPLEDFRSYAKTLNDGDSVIECEPSNCMFGTNGVIYIKNINGVDQRCVMWFLENNARMGTSITWGTRKLSDTEE